MGVTCFSGPVFLNCCVATPDVHYELRELHDGKVIDGVRYTAKGHTFCAHACKRGLPDGDTITFRTALRCRRARTWYSWPPIALPRQPPGRTRAEAPVLLYSRYSRCSFM